MLMSTAAVWRPKCPVFATLTREALIRAGLIVLVCLWLMAIVVLPLVSLLSKSLMDSGGHFVGLANFRQYFNTPALSQSLGNSLFVAAMTTAIAVPSGFAFAYALTRSGLPAKSFFKAIALMPLFAPTLLNGIALVYLFGRKGLVTRGFFGLVPGLDIHLYGAVGIIIAEVLYTFPQAMLILSVALSLADGRLYEAAQSLGAGRSAMVCSVPWPFASSWPSPILAPPRSWAAPSTSWPPIFTSK